VNLMVGGILDPASREYQAPRWYKLRGIKR
jgi:hypothetical protein